MGTFYEPYDPRKTIMHYGVKGMKWGKRAYQQGVEPPANVNRPGGDYVKFTPRTDSFRKTKRRDGGNKITDTVNDVAEKINSKNREWTMNDDAHKSKILRTPKVRIPIHNRELRTESRSTENIPTQRVHNGNRMGVKPSNIASNAVNKMADNVQKSLSGKRPGGTTKNNLVKDTKKTAAKIQADYVKGILTGKYGTKKKKH